MLVGLTAASCSNSDDNSTSSEELSTARDDDADDTRTDDAETDGNDQSSDGGMSEDDSSDGADDADETRDGDTSEDDSNNDDPSDDDTPPDDTTESDAGLVSSEDAGELTPLDGAFRIQLVAPVEETEEIAASPGYVAVLGRVYDGPQPARTRWVSVDEQAGCELFAPEIPFCDPECSGGAVCNADDTCQAPPTPLDLGTVTLEGLATESGDAVSMSPLPPSNSYQPTASAGLVYPPFAPGDEVTLHVAGNRSEGVPGFSIAGQGVSQLELANDGNLRFAPDENSLITWEPPDDDDVSHVELIFDISHHGGQKGELRCDVEDTGQFEVPAALVTGLIELGVAGFPEVRIIRKTVERAEETVGNVSLTIESAAVQYLDIPGVVSCAEIGSEAGCPDGQVCQQDLRCAE